MVRSVYAASRTLGVEMLRIGNVETLLLSSGMTDAGGIFGDSKVALSPELAGVRGVRNGCV